MDVSIICVYNQIKTFGTGSVPIPRYKNAMPIYFGLICKAILNHLVHRFRTVCLSASTE